MKVIELVIHCMAVEQTDCDGCERTKECEKYGKRLQELAKFGVPADLIKLLQEEI